MSAIIMEKTYPVPKELVWKWLTDDELLGLWCMKSTGMTLEIGAHFTFETPPTPIWSGVFKNTLTEFVTNELLVYTSLTDKPQLTTEIRWTLSETNGQTTLKLVHSGFTVKQLMVQSMIYHNWRVMVHDALYARLVQAHATASL